MEKNSGPLSPHLQIYKWQFSSLLSITHRLTGTINTVGFFVIVLWILFLALGPEYYNFYQKFLRSFIGKFILVGFTWSFVYHMFNGIIHLAWDFGYGYEIKVANIYGIIILFIYILKKYLIQIVKNGVFSSMVQVVAQVFGISKLRPILKILIYC